MSEIKDIIDGFNSWYIIQQKKPDLYKQLEDVLNEVKLPFFDAFIKGGIECNEEKLKSLMLDKDISFPSKESPSKEEIEPEI